MGGYRESVPMMAAGGIERHGCGQALCVRSFVTPGLERGTTRVTVPG